MPLVQVTAPSVEPVSLEDARAFLKLDSDQTEDDALIGVLISAARQYAETVCDCAFVSRDWRLTLDAFPGPSLMGVPYGVAYTLPGHAIYLEKCPNPATGPVAVSVASITYTAMDRSTQTMPAENYKVDLSGPIPRITPIFGQIWPIQLPEIGSVQVTYTAGYGATAAAVPAGIKHWMLMRIKSLYDNRGEIAQVERGRLEPLPWVDCLLDPYKVVWG